MNPRGQPASDTAVVADEQYGMIPTFLDGVAAEGEWYLAEVPASTKVWEGDPVVEPAGRGPLGRPRTYARVAAGAPKAQEVRQLAARLPARAWRRSTIKEGSKGPIEADFAFVRVTRARRGRPGLCGWLILRRSLGGAQEVKYFLSHAPASCPPAALVRVSGLRWPVETALEEAKGELGMDHYETRTWRGWRHHLAQTLVLLAVVLPRPQLNVPHALAIVRSYQVRNYAAYRSHRKRTLRRHHQRGPPRAKKSQVSL